MASSIIKIIIAILFLVLFGIAGEMDYQDHISNRPATIEY